MTNTQKQHLLAYLGYYTISVDGKWGAKSTQATKDFQRDYGLSVDGIFGPDTEKRILEVIASGEQPQSDEVRWDEIKYFKAKEFACKCGGKYCNGAPDVMKHKLLVVADRLREHFGAEAVVSSGLRCKTHNANEGGVTNSRHLSGKAMDFRVRGVSGATLLAYVKAQPEIRYAYRINGGSYVHMDIE